MSLLCLEEISFRYPGGAALLDGLSLSVEAGAISAILGPNGCGKTTVLDICMGFRKPDAGRVLLEGKPLSAWSARARGAAVSLVPQRENVRFAFSVTDYVLLGRAPHLPPLAQPADTDYNAVREALAAMGISGLAHRSITALSGGEYRLMLIARSLSQAPSLMLLDEPAGHLDPANAALVVRLMRELRKRGVGVLYTGHDPQTAAACADTVHILSGGRCRRSGPPEKIITEENLEEAYGIRPKILRAEGSLYIRWE